MEALYQKDIDFLLMELEHHEYIARKSAQKHQEQYADAFANMCAEIRTSIEIMKERQTSAISEWSSLDLPTRQSALTPLCNAMAEVISNLQKNSCVEFATYLEAAFSGFLTDLLDYPK